MGLFDRLMQPQAAPRRNLMDTQMVRRPSESYLRQDYPTVYGALGGLLGTAPDEMAGSVLDPNTAAVRRGAEYGFPVGTALGVLPAARFTKGLPVGMGIKDVSPKIGINVNQGGSSFADKIISGEKKFETRESDSLRAYVGKRVGIIRTGEGKAKAIGDVTLGEPIVVSSPEEFAKLRDLHLVPEGSKFDIKQGGVKYLYPIENPVPYGVEKDVAKYGIVSRKILGEPDTLEKALYPQQAALDLAQQRAALPIEQGGLGFPTGNTAEQRAAAMGFNTDAYHGTNKDFLAFDKNKRGSATDQGWYGSGEYSSPSANGANAYAMTDFPNYKESANIMPLLLKNPEFITNKHGYITEYVTREPEQIRSRFAAFDPFRRSAAIAATMGVAAPDLLANELDYPSNPMYTDPLGYSIR